jgi:hypothetical protein
VRDPQRGTRAAAARRARRRPGIAERHGITKDNYIFGVRAVDTDGNRSVVSFRSPQ